MQKYPCSGRLSYIHKKLLGKHLSFNFCCEEHDFAYGEGGTKADRKLADIRFRRCIQTYSKSRLKRAWLWLAGWVIYATVRIFGKNRSNYQGRAEQ